MPDFVCVHFSAKCPPRGFFLKFLEKLHDCQMAAPQKYYQTARGKAELTSVCRHRLDGLSVSEGGQRRILEVLGFKAGLLMEGLRIDKLVA